MEKKETGEMGPFAAPPKPVRPGLNNAQVSDDSAPPPLLPMKKKHAVPDASTEKQRNSIVSPFLI